MDLADLKSRENARKALIKCNETAEKVGLSKMCMDEINAEINAVREGRASS